MPYTFMAQKKSSKSTSFGKKSGAEKSFHKKRSSKRDEGFGEKSSKPRSQFAKRSSRPSGSDKPRSRREFDAGEETPFKKPVAFRREDFKKRTKTDSPNTSKDFKKDSYREEGQKRARTKPTIKRQGKSEDATPYIKKSSPSFDPRKEGGFKKKVRPQLPPSAYKKDDGLTRLNKYIANSGMGSRREADEMIKMGLISVNGVTITEMGHKVKAGDVVRYEDKLLKAEQPVYILLNKPKGFITTTADPKDRKTVMNLVASACKERIYPVGRLDRNTTGLLLLTNDGALAEKLMHPSYNIKKIYKVDLDKPLAKNDLVKIQEGVRLEEGKAMVDDVAILSDDKKSVGLELHIGWNRIVRRIFEALDYEVVKLDRVVYAGLDKKDLPRGEWRFLKTEEIVRLKHFK